MAKAIFLDRDGTINEDVGDLFLEDKLVFIPRAIEALKLLQERFALFIVTNQPGIGKNVFNEKEYSVFNNNFHSILRKEGVKIIKTYHCPHKNKDNCICHKPKTYFMKQAEKEYGIDLTGSYVVGDHPHDIEMGSCAGAKTVYLLSGHGNKHRNEMLIQPDRISEDLYGASKWILKIE